MIRYIFVLPLFTCFLNAVNTPFIPDIPGVSPETMKLIRTASNPNIKAEDKAKQIGAINAEQKAHDALFKAAEQDDVEQLKTALKTMNVDTQDSVLGQTALMHASVKGSRNAIKELLANSANPNIVDVSGKTALMYAVENSQNEVVKELVAYKPTDKKLAVDINALDLGKQSALMLAIRKGNENGAILLIDAGADTEILDDHKESALLIATKANLTKTVKALVAKKAQVNRANSLLIAAKNNKPELVTLLLGSGARTDIQDSDGKTFADYAKLNPDVQQAWDDYQAEQLVAKAPAQEKAGAAKKIPAQVTQPQDTAPQEQSPVSLPSSQEPTVAVQVTQPQDTAPQEQSSVSLPSSQEPTNE